MNAKLGRSQRYKLCGDHCADDLLDKPHSALRAYVVLRAVLTGI